MIKKINKLLTVLVIATVGLVMFGNEVYAAWWPTEINSWNNNQGNKLEMRLTDSTTTRSEAVAEIDRLCNNSSVTYAHAGYVSSVEFASVSGNVKYKIGVLWKLCKAASDTTYFAITGYNGGNAGNIGLCPLAGWYRGDSPTVEYSNTMDCVKYTTSSTYPYGLGDYTSSADPAIGKCSPNRVVNDCSPPKGDGLGWNTVYQGTGRPVVDTLYEKTFSYTDTRLAATWSTDQRSNGNHVFVNGNIGGFWRNSSGDQSNIRPYLVRGAVQWTVTVPPAPWRVNPTCTVDRTTVGIDETVTFTHKIQATGNPPNDPKTTWGNSGSDAFTLTETMGDNASRTQPTYYKPVPGTAHGTQVTRNTFVYPTSNTNDGRTTVNCPTVTVVNNWTVTPKTNIRITDIASGSYVTGTGNSGNPWYYTESNFTNGGTTLYIRPGQRVEWKHMVKQDGPSKTDQTVWAHSDFWPKGTITTNAPMNNPNAAFPAGTGEDHSANWSAGSGWASGSTGWYNTSAGWTTESRNFTQDDVSDDVNRNTFCSRLTAGPRQNGLGAISTGNLTNSGNHCVSIPYHYGLDPTTKVNSDVNVGDKVQFTYEVKNNGPTKSKDNTNDTAYWHMAFYATNDQYNNLISPNMGRANFASGQSYPARRWAALASTSLTVTDIARNGTLGVINAGETKGTGSWDINTNDYPYMTAGGWVCSYLVVFNRGYNNGAAYGDPYRASNIACTRLVQSPQIQLRGADSYSQDIFQGKPSTNQIRGSWSQYGIFSDGNKTQAFGSAGWTANSGNRSASANGNKLTFANTNDLEAFGSKRTVDWPANWDRNVCGITMSTNIGLLANGDYVCNGDITLAVGGQIPAGKSIRIRTTGNVNINTNISFPDSYSGLAQIPHFIIMAGGNINVADTVARLDGVYVSRGFFNTCGSGQNSGVAALSTSGICHRQLTINGAVVTRASKLQRTIGGGKAYPDEPDKPAEIFNYTPNMFLTPYITRANASGAVSVDKIVELPPRY